MINGLFINKTLRLEWSGFELQYRTIPDSKSRGLIERRFKPPENAPLKQTGICVRAAVHAFDRRENREFLCGFAEQHTLLPHK